MTFINSVRDHGNQVSEKPFSGYCVRGNGISAVSNMLPRDRNFHQENRVSYTCKTHVRRFPEIPHTTISYFIALFRNIYRSN